MNKEAYKSDTRYEKVFHNMELLGITDVTTNRQHRNGTVVWQLPIKNNNSGKTFIEVASFSTGYVRNQNSGYSNYQLNKRCEGEPEYFELPNGDYRKFTTKSCKLIPIEIDRLEYLISYCLKNYFVKRANEVADGEYVHKSLHKWKLEKLKRECNQAYDCGLSDAKTKANELEDRIYELESQVDVANDKLVNSKDYTTDLKAQLHALQEELAETKVRQDVSVIVNGHRYKVL